MDIILVSVLCGVWVIGLSSYIVMDKKRKNSKKLHYYNYKNYYIKFKKFNDSLNDSTKKLFK